MTQDDLRRWLTPRASLELPAGWRPRCAHRWARLESPQLGLTGLIEPDPESRPPRPADVHLEFQSPPLSRDSGLVGEPRALRGRFWSLSACAEQALARLRPASDARACALHLHLAWSEHEGASRLQLLARHVDDDGATLRAVGVCELEPEAEPLWILFGTRGVGGAQELDDALLLAMRTAQPLEEDWDPELEGLIVTEDGAFAFALPKGWRATGDYLFSSPDERLLVRVDDHFGCRSGSAAGLALRLKGRARAFDTPRDVSLDPAPPETLPHEAFEVALAAPSGGVRMITAALMPLPRLGLAVSAVEQGFTGEDDAEGDEDALRGALARALPTLRFRGLKENRDDP